MTAEELTEIISNKTAKWEGDNAFQGLCIIRKYIKDKDILVGAEHDIIYSVSVEDLAESGITEEDAVELGRLNWTIEYESMACFV